MTSQLETTPEFANEAEERAFWEANDSTDYLDWTKAQSIVLPNLKPTDNLSAPSPALAGFDQSRCQFL